MKVIVAVLLLCAVAFADDYKKYAGQVVISPDPVPTAAGELPKFLAANATKDGHYDLIKGPPWDINLAAILAKDPGSAPVQLVFLEADKPLQTIDVSAHNKMVLAHTSATAAAGFAAGKTYAVRVMRDKTVLARAELTLRN